MKGRSVSSSWLGIFFTAAVAQGADAVGTGPWINEFHYDNTGTDVGEFVEIAVPWTLTDLASVRLTLYNGGDGRPYGSAHLLTTFAAGDTIEGITFYSKSISGMQNGAPDGLSLDVAGEVVHFVSYEGVFTGSQGPAAGLGSLDIGVFQDDTTRAGASVGLIGAGARPEDFLWASLPEATPGGLNLGQAITVPEPRVPVLLAWMAGGLLLGRRRRR